MKNSWLVLPVTLFLLASSGNSMAQPEVLDSLINIALENNPGLNSTEYIRKSAEYSARSSGSLPDPSVTVGFMNLPANSLSLDETPMSGVNIGVSQKIPWPGKLSNQRNLADLTHRVAGADVETYKNQIVRQVTDAYYDYSCQTLSVPIIEEFLGLLKATRDISELRYGNGEVPAQDMLRISTMMSRTEIRLLNARQKQYEALVNLRQITGDYAMSDTLASYLPEPIQENGASFTIANNPILSKAALNIEKSEANRKLSHSDYWPDLMLGVDYVIRKQVTGDPVKGADFLSFKVGFTLPLWFFKKQNNNSRAAERKLLASREQEHSVRDQLTARLNETNSRLNTELKSLQQYDSSILPEAKAAVEAAEVAYEVGQVDFNGLLAAQSDYFEIKLERLNLLKQYHQSRAILTELSGNSIKR